MLALSSFTWAVAGGLALASILILMRVTVALIGRIKDLTKTLSGASGQLNEAMEAMRADLDQVNEGLAGLRKDQPE